MMLGQSSDRIRVAKPWSTASYLTFALLLSSCGGGATDTATDNIPADSVESGPAASAAQLSYDANYSIDFAQSVAAGLEDAPQPQSANTPVIGAANSASDIPTTDTSQAVVIFEPESDSDANNGNGTDNNTDASNGNGSNTEASNGNNIDGNNNESANSNPSVDENANTGSDTVDVTEPSDTTGDIDSNTDVNTDSEIEFESIEAQGAEPTSGSTDQSTEPAGEPSPNNAEATDPEEEPTAGENTDVDYPGTDTGTDPAPEQNEVSEPDQGAATATDASNTDTDTQFFSKTTPGFNGEVLEDSIRVTWPVDPDARGYNVYRQAQFVTSVFTEEYIDEDVHDSNYYYEIQAFDNSDRLYYIATGLTVKPRSFGTIDPDAPIPNDNLLDGYELVFADEFNGQTLDSTKWNTSYLWGTDLIINSEEQYYVDILNEPDFGFNPFTFDGEHLTINSIETPEHLSGRARNQPYLSGVITSYDAFKFTYGYVETRAKVTFGRGYWPAFWLLNAYYVDDKPEIDIMEFIGHDQDVVYHTYHYYDAEGRLRSTHSQPTPGVDYTSDFHTYAVEWSPGTIIFYIDNVEVHRVIDPKVSQQEMYVIANTALGGWWAGPPDETTPFPGEYTLDYIRVYQRTQPYDDVLFDDGLTQVPYADDNIGLSSPSHRPSIEDWPEGYPDGL